MAVTFIACLGIGLDYGMLIGIGINLMFILYSSARPKVQVRNLTVSLLLVKYFYGFRYVRFSGIEYYNEQGTTCRSLLITQEYFSYHHHRHIICLTTCT